MTNGEAGPAINSVPNADNGPSEFGLSQQNLAEIQEDGNTGQQSSVGVVDDSHRPSVVNPSETLTGSIDRGSRPAPIEEASSRTQCARRAPNHLQDYVCYIAQPKDLAFVYPLHKVSSGKPHPIANYVSCENFSDVHRNFLAAIIKVI